MGLFFDDPLFEEFTSTLALGLASHGGAELGEVQAACAGIVDGDDRSWFEAWRATADRLVETGDACAAGGHRVSASESYLRASLYYALAYHPLFGAPPDPRLLDAFGSQRAAFDKAAALLEPAGEAVEIDFEGASSPGYLFRAVPGERRPLLIATNGYDATIYEMFLGQAVPALRRGYHCLVFDGPGQGAVLFEQGVPIRADWETVIRAVVDAVVEREEIDAERIALTGWSLGGYLALRAAAGEPRLAACIADPALFSIGAGVVGRMRAAGVSDSVIERYPNIDDDTLAPIAEAIHGDRAQRWAVEQRGFWVHGVSTLGGYVRATFPFSLKGRLDAISCPTALTAAEDDPLASSTDHVHDELRCPKTILRVTAAEGAGDHCEMRNRSLLDQRVFDWLDDVLSTPRR
ncbi:MAG: alpha/beta fold hydrolase [Thermoleophilaceae bacterium]|nr:alpha/beta fold hydrolase [Thermoleophilaceae bacterium]